MQTEPNKLVARLKQIGISAEEAGKALLLLGVDGADPELVAERVEHLVKLTRACGTLQSAKLAYSLAGRSGVPLTSHSCTLLAEAVRCSECVPAGVRLWKTAVEAGVTEELFLGTAARLGEDGAEQIRVLEALKAHPERLPLAAELARKLKSPAWECDGSWGGVSDPDRGLVWWDNAVPAQRKAYGMTLTATTLNLRNRLEARFVFEARHQILGTTDRCHLEISLDGTRWEKLIKFEGESNWKSYEVDLSKFGDKEVSLRFHVLSGGHREGRGMEVAGARLEAVQVTRQERLEFDPLPEGWEEEADSAALVARVSDASLSSKPFSLGQMVSPTVTVEARIQASSVYAEATLELVESDGKVLLTEALNPTPEPRLLSLPVPSTEKELTLRLWSRFARRREHDGFWIRDVRLRGGKEESRETIWVEGGQGDGAREHRAVLERLESEQGEELERLVRLRRGLPSLRSALALAELLECEEQIPALLLLFSRLKEDAIPAFRLLQDLSKEEDLLLQASILLVAGVDRYPSTRDHLGDGLLPVPEFEDNGKLYLELRKNWTEEEARRGLSLILTPVGAEDATVRREQFTRLLESESEAENVFQAWERSF